MAATLKAAICALFLTAIQGAYASPTSEDFQFCHRAAAASLEHCLDRHMGAGDKICWSEARTMKQRCYADINKKYARHPAEEKKKQEAARKADEEALIRMQQESK